MRALVKTAAGVALVADRPAPTVRDDDDVIVQVACAGVCRSDLFVADGRLQSAPDLVLGHEGAGVVIARGSAVDIPLGAHVAIRPIFGCGACAGCSAHVVDGCLQRQMLGIDLDGVFAEQVRVPARNALVVPDHVAWSHAAYLEPLAASLAVLRPLRKGRAMLPAEPAIVILGANRIAELTARVLRAAGFGTVSVHSPEDAPPANSADVVIETTLAGTAADTIVDVARPGAVVILKSRPPGAVALSTTAIVRKELVLWGAHYGAWDEAVAWLATERVALADLVGDMFALHAYRDAFAVAAAEQRKPFLLPGLE